MDNIKLKAIEYFASKPHDDEKAKKFLTSEYSAIQKTLRSSTSYDEISNACEVLHKFISHVAVDSIQDIGHCWERLHGPDDIEVRDGFLGRYQTKEKIYSQLISLLNKLRYLEQDKIMPMLIGFWKEDKLLREDVEKVFKELAQFNLSAYEQIRFIPQLKLQKYLSNFSNEELIKLFPILSTVYQQLLSTELEGAHWNYRTVTISSIGIPASEDIREIRNTTVSSLIYLYRISEQVSHKKSLLNLMNSACRIWSRQELQEESKLIVEQNAVQVMSYWASLVNSEPFELVQQIEHDAYWNYYHTSSEEVTEAALIIKKAIEENSEYHIYRDLVGFEGIFIEWDKDAGLHASYDEQKKVREERINTHINSVTDENISNWIERVELYLKTESRDLATFPELFKFLESISRKCPKEVLSCFLEKDSLDKGAISIIRGLWNSEIHDEFLDQVERFIDSSSYLWELSVAFLSIDNIKPELLVKFIDRLISDNDISSLSSILRIFNNNEPRFSEEFTNKEINKIFECFNSNKNTSWINEVWFTSIEDSFILFLNDENVWLILKNLVYADDIEYHIEYILKQIAEISIDYIFSFLALRISHYRGLEDNSEKDYRPIPYSLNTLGKVLSNYPDKIISFIKENNNKDIISGSFGIASLYKKCFARFNPEHTGLILKYLNSDEESDFTIIRNICASYNGSSSILPLIKVIIENTDYNKRKYHLLALTLLNTGVITGDYGRIESFNKKLSDIESWHTDCNKNVVIFAKMYAEMLKEGIVEETIRVEERIEVEKHIYGDGE